MGFFKQVLAGYGAGTVTQRRFTQTFHFEMHSGVVVVDVEIQKKHYKFMFDTGAFSIIPTSLEKKLSLKPLDEKIDTVDAQGKQARLSLYKLPSLSLGGIEFKDFRVLSNDFASLFPTSCLGFDGIIGYNFLQNLSVKIDYANHTITLSDQKIPHKGYVKTKMKFHTQYAPLIRFRVDKRDIWVGLDSGKNDGLLFGERALGEVFRAKGFESKKISGVYASSFHGAGMDGHKETFVVHSFSIDKKIKIDTYPVDIDESGQFLAGNAFLSHFDLILDFARKNVYLKPLYKGDLTQDFERSFGFSLFLDDQKGLYISALQENTPASRAGLEFGARVLEINNQDTLHFTQQDYCKLISQKVLQVHDFLEIVIQKTDGKIVRKMLRKD